MKRIGGRRSGPEAECILRLIRTLETIDGVMTMSSMPVRGVLERVGKGGRRPSSLVKDDWKYWLSNSHLSESEVRRKPDELRRGEYRMVSLVLS